MLFATNPPKQTRIKTFPPRLNKAHMPRRDTQKKVTKQCHLRSYIQHKYYSRSPSLRCVIPTQMGASPHYSYPLYTIVINQLALHLVLSTQKVMVNIIYSPQCSPKKPFTSCLWTGFKQYRSFIFINKFHSHFHLAEVKQSTGCIIIM